MDKISENPRKSQDTEGCMDQSSDFWDWSSVQLPITFYPEKDSSLSVGQDLTVELSRVKGRDGAIIRILGCANPK